MPPEIAEPIAAKPTGANADQSFANLLDQITCQLEQQGKLDADEIIRAHPQHADRLRRVLPAMAAMASWARDPASAAADGKKSSPSSHAAGVLGDFRIIDEIGRGGMGVVYEAEQISLRRRVALKTLPFAAVLDKRNLQRFKNEALAAATLDHPNIVSVYAVGEERGVHFFAMQLIRGQTLAEVICQLRKERDKDSSPPPRNRDFPPPFQNQDFPPPLGGEGASEHGRPNVARAQCGRQSRSEREGGSASHDAPTIDSAIATPPSTKKIEQARLSTVAGSRNDAERYRSAARLGIQAAEALQHAHDAGVLHRDIKPGNLMLDADGQLYITDFGLARMETDVGMTMTGDIIGTLRYMAPEQALAKRVVIDHRADVYSLGATLYELLTLEPAFGQTDRSELLKHMAFTEPRSLRKIDRRIPAELETIVRKAMAKSPDERYQTARRLADDLRSFLDDKPIKAKPPTILQGAVKWSRRHRPAVWATASTLLISILVVAGSIGWKIRDRETQQLARTLEVQHQLDTADRLSKENNWPEAMEAAERAGAFLATGDVDAATENRMRLVMADLNLIRRLEEADLASTPVAKDRLYAATFADAGCPVDTLTVEQARELLRRHTRIATQLAAALTDWATVRQQYMKKSDSRNWQHLLAIADTIDPDPWRLRLRAAWRITDQEDALSRLRELADSTDLRKLQPSDIVPFCQLLGAKVSHEEAAKLARQAQAVFPDDFWINYRLSAELSFTNQSQALQFARAAVALRPTNLGALYTLANMLVALKEFEEAIDVCQRAIAIDHNYSLPYISLSGAYLAQGKLAEAVDVMRQAMEVEPDSAWIIADVGYMLEQANDLESAIEHYKMAIRTDPEYAWAHFALGRALQKQGKLDVAIEHLKDALKLDPDYPWSYTHLANALLDKGKLDEALATCREARHIHDDQYTSRGRGEVYCKLGQYRDAVADFERAAELNPINVNTLNQFAWLLATAPDQNARNGKRAIELATTACELAEYKNPGIVDTLAAAHAEAGDFESAVKWAEKAIELSPGDKERAELAKHLEFFQNEKPWREPAPGGD